MGDESGEGFDPCACMWNHDLAMQRLLSIVSLRLFVLNNGDLFENVQYTSRIRRESCEISSSMRFAGCLRLRELNFEL